MSIVKRLKTRFDQLMGISKRRNDRAVENHRQACQEFEQLYREVYRD